MTPTMTPTTALVLTVLVAFLATQVEGRWWSKSKNQVEDEESHHLRRLTGCEPLELNFNELSRGEYVQDQYFAAYGLALSATGGHGGFPRVFDTSNPGTAKDGDPDLGSPNEACNPSGPGVGAAGSPGNHPGENCEAQGNALIIEEDGDGNPDDNQEGGSITFTFSPPAKYVFEMGFLDIDYDTSVTIHGAEGGQVKKDLLVLGDNSFQKLDINLGNVAMIEVSFKRSGAIPFIKLCPGERPPADECLPTQFVRDGWLRLDWTDNDNFFVCASRYRGTNADTGEQEEYTIGQLSAVSCRPKVCRVLDPDAPPPCVVGKDYEKPCCLASDPGCTEANQCGEVCPDGTLVKVGGCNTVDCFDWDETEFFVEQSVVNIDCLNTGHYNKGGVQYDWAIICGPQYSGGAVEENRAPYEYQCYAFRQGVYPDVSAGLPCQFIQLAIRAVSEGETCNCNTVDVYPFGLPTIPDTPCLTTEQCPLLCYDAGYEKARFACYGFPDDIEFWNVVGWWSQDSRGEENLAAAETFEIHTYG